MLAALHDILVSSPADFTVASNIPNLSSQPSNFTPSSSSTSSSHPVPCSSNGMQVRYHLLHYPVFNKTAPTASINSTFSMCLGQVVLPRLRLVFGGSTRAAESPSPSSVKYFQDPHRTCVMRQVSSISRMSIDYGTSLVIFAGTVD